ncbi:MAG: hypothetical protein CMH55_06015 [Myxococcales bacterium]|nr:hypothetical protein [Myxococcales bacterium]
MYRFLTFLILGWGASTFAMAPPLSPEELATSALVIVDGRVIQVECMGSPERAEDSAMVTPLKAYLEVSGIEKKPAEGQAWGDLLIGDSIELHFDKRDYGTRPQPGCAWVPSYREGQSGRWWLRAEDVDRLTMVSWNSFEAAEDHAPLDLPECGGSDGGPGPEADGGQGAEDGGVEPVADSGLEPFVDGGSEGAADAGPASVDGGLAQDEDEAGGCSCSGLGAEFALWPLVGFIGLRRRRR